MRPPIRTVRSLAAVLLAIATVGCGNPLQVATWLELAPGSQVEAAGTTTPIEGGIFVRVAVDLTNLLNPVGTIDVDQVRIGGQGGLFGQMCLRKDTDNDPGGSFSFNLLTGVQEVDFPFATIVSSTTLDLISLGDLAVLASPEGLAFPTDPALFAPVFDVGSMDGVLTLPVALEQDFELAPGFVIPAVVNLVLTSASRPHVFDDGALLDYCEPKWELQGQPAAPFVLNPKGTYLHHVNEPNPQPPLVVDLEEIGALPGDTLTLRRGGRWEGFFQGNQQRITGVFSSSDVLLPVVAPATWANFWHWLNFQSVRVPGAINAGVDVVTPLTLAFLNRSDIPHDFEVTGSTVIEVPAGARYLFFSPFDVAYSDNYTSSLRVSIEVEPAF